MAVILIPSTFIWGTVDPKPIIDAVEPGARVRVRMRPHSWVQAFIKTPGRIRHCFIVQRGEFWGFDNFIAENRTAI